MHNSDIFLSRSNKRYKKEVKQDIKCNWLIAFDFKDISDEDILSCAKDIGADGIGARITKD